MWQEDVVVSRLYWVWGMLWHQGRSAEDLLRPAAAGNAGVDRSILGFDLLVSSAGLSPVGESSDPPPPHNVLSLHPYSTEADFTALSLSLSLYIKSKDLTRRDQYSVSHAWNGQMFGISFSEARGFCWVKWINAASVCEGVDPQLLKGGWCDFCPSWGFQDVCTSQASPVLLNYWCRHLHRQSVQWKQLSWSERGLDVKQQVCDWELICSFANCVSKSE